MNIEGLNKAKVLAALYNNAKPLGLGSLQYSHGDMDEKEAEEILNRSSDKYFDYLGGRVMKIRLDKDDVSTHLYNRDNGPNAAEEAIANMVEYGLLSGLAQPEEAKTERVCKSCGKPENNHPYRHPFEAVEFRRAQPEKEGE